MATPDLDNAAAQPQTASTKAGSVGQFSLTEQIAYDRYKIAKAARALPFGGAVFSKVLPAAAVPDQQATGISLQGFDNGFV